MKSFIPIILLCFLTACTPRIVKDIEDATENIVEEIADEIIEEIAD